MNLTNLFRTQKDDRIEALRRAVAENEEESNWRESFLAKAEFLRRTSEDARAALVENPSQKNVERFLEASRERNEKCENLQAASHCMIAGVTARKIERTRAPLRGALEAVLERLESERAELANRDLATAEELGLAAGDTTSPVLRKIDEAISLGKSYLSRVDQMDSNQMRSPIEFCLE